MKRFCVFTLIALFATVSVFLTHLDAFDSDWQFDTQFDGTVYGETNVAVWFDDPIAHSSHAFYVWNLELKRSPHPPNVKFTLNFFSFISIINRIDRHKSVIRE